ncbi:ArsR/SmtB family transcription factor [Lacibacterium aquatile]|uniref:ArsR/SmtB family transcription factor n=1 Tax=Lacibacterium aquatile TaxID=1168082 RepID=A0ABW5DYX1_9PROT
MVDHISPTHRLDTVFHALSDATRRAMLQRLGREDQSVTALAEPFSISLAAASKHIKVLEGAGLIRREVRGRTHLCRIEAGPMREAMEWLNHYGRFWDARLDDLERALAEDETEKQEPTDDHS